MATEELVEDASGLAPQASLCMCESYVRATERAALAGARWLGRADQESAEESAFSGMEAALAQLPISGSVVIGAGDVEAGSAMSGTVGAGGDHVDLALDPLEGRGVVARGGNGAISMIVVGEPGKLRHLPDMYMRSIAVGPRARGRISLLQPVEENVRNIAEAFGRGTGRDRARSLEIARGETEETIQHLKANFRVNRIAPQDYWPRHNLLVVIVKMLDSFLRH